jgi:ABC-2 type transport system permease protein
MVSVRRIGSDLVTYARGFMRSRVGLFFSLAFPIILILLFGAIFSGGSSGPIPVYLQNEDAAGQISGAFIHSLNATGTLEIRLVGASQNISQFLLSHSSSDAIVIPASFSRDYEAHQPVNVTIYGNPDSSTSSIVLGVTDGIVNAFNLRAANQMQVIGVNLLTFQSYEYIDFLIPGMVGFAILLSPMFALVNVSSQYKRDKIFKQLSLTPLTKTEWLVSKILFYIILTAISFVLMMLLGKYGFNARVSPSLQVVPFLLLGPFLFVSLGMLVGTVSTSVESAAVVGNLITFPMMFLSGTFFPVSQMPMYLQSFAHVLPLFYVIDGLNNVMLYGNAKLALSDIGVLLVVSAVIFALAVRFFKWRED